MTGAALIVSLLVFSGRESPRWTVPPTSVDQLEAALAAMPALERPCEPPSGLGYTGVRIQVSKDTNAAGEWTVGRGVALSGGRCFLDTGRKVEKLALASGRGAFDASLVPADLLS